MNKLAIVAAAALTAATFGAVAIAQDTTVGDFQSADANKDNLVSWEEAFGLFPTLTQDLFNKADSNGDGSLDEGEFTGLLGLTAGANATETSSSDSSSVSSDSSSESSSSAP